MCVSTSYFVIWCYFLLQGIQVAVILPTLNLYLLSSGAEQDFIGMVMASGTFSTLVAAPIFGRISDKLQSIKPVLIVGTMFQFLGSFIYFIAKSPIVILTGMVVSGVGPGTESSILGTIARRSSEENRVAAFSKVFATFQVGLLVGSVINVFFAKLNVDVGPFTINPYTSPGLFMSLLWALYQVLVVCCYRDEHRLSQHENVVQRQVLTWQVISQGLLREEVVVCLWSSFMLIFMQSGFETWFAPFTKTHFAWIGWQNAWLIGGLSVTTILGFFAVVNVSKKLPSNLILLIGTCALFADQVIFLVLMILLRKENGFSGLQDNSKWAEIIFSFGTVAFALFMSFVTATQVSIYSKVINKDHMDFFQGFRLLVYGIGQIMGPMFATGLLACLHVVVMVNSLFVKLSLASVVISYKRLGRTDTTSDDNGSLEIEDENPNERTNLLIKN